MFVVILILSRGPAQHEAKGRNGANDDMHVGKKITRISILYLCQSSSLFRTMDSSLPDIRRLDELL